MIITEGLLLAMGVSLLLLALGMKMKALPLIFISSLGWLIAGLQVYQQTEEVLPMALLIMLAFSQFFLIRSER